MKRCIHCNNENLDAAKFCDQCGAALSGVGETPEPPVSAAPSQTPSQLPVGDHLSLDGRQTTKGVLRSLMTGVEYILEPGREYMIGRGDPARGLRPDICLEEPAALQKGVSRLHAKVLFDAGNFYLVDLNSTNSAYINGNKLVPQQAYSLRSGDMVELGNYKLSFNWL